MKRTARLIFFAVLALVILFLVWQEGYMTGFNDAPSIRVRDGRI